MNDSFSPPLAQLDATQQDAQNTTAGQSIRIARIQKGVDLSLLSVTLKVPMQQLEALEADQHEAFKGPVYVRALASSVCRQLHMDPSQVLALLPPLADRLSVYRPRLDPLIADNALDFQRFKFLRSISVQTVYVALLMLALIAALLWMPAPSTWPWFQSAPKDAVPMEKSVSVMPASDQESSAPVQASQPQASESVAAEQTPAAAMLAASVSQALVTSAASTTPATSAITASSGVLLGFSATNDSWIEIRSSQNQVLWSRVMHAGESVELQYPLPLNVVVGRASVVRMTYKGKPFDLAPHTKVTVARFEVKE